MGKWDQYQITDSPTHTTSKWDKYSIPIKTEEGDKWLPLIGKSALKGAMAIADLPKIAANVTEKTINLGRKTSGNPAEVYWATQDPNATNKPKITTIENAPQTDYSRYIPSTEGARANIKKYWGVDLNPNPDSPAKKIISTGADFATSALPWMGPSQGANLLNQFKNMARNTKAAALVGTGSGALQASGVDPLISDLTAGAINPSSAKLVKNRARDIGRNINLPQRIMGLGPNRINLKAARAANALDIDLPAAVLTDSTLTALADQTIAKTPFFGNILKNKYDKVQTKAHKHLEDVYNEIGPLDTPDIDKKINDLYDASRSARPEDAIIKPTNTIPAINDLNKTLVSDISSPDRVKLKAYVKSLKQKLDPTISNKFGNIKLPIQDYAINKLIDAKVNLNDIIKHDVKGDALNRLMKINDGVNADLAEYGKINPEWYDKLKKADDLYASVAKRKKTEKILRQQGTMGEAEDLSYSALNNTINNRENRRLLKRDAPAETYEKIINLGRLSNAMVKKGRRIPNPSGTVPTAAALGLLTSFYLNPVGTVTVGGIAQVLGVAGTTRLLTNKKFLDSALKFAEDKSKGKLASGMKLNKQAKDITGYTLNSIYKAVQRENNKEEIDGLQ